MLSGLPSDEITSDLDIWLVNGGRIDPKASFVFSAWLDAPATLDEPERLDKIDKVNKVEGHVLAWLGRYETSEDAQFVYTSWLNAAANLGKPECLDKIGKVEAHAVAWLGRHETTEIARFAYTAWLDAAATLDKSECLSKIGKIEAHALAWLGKHQTSEDARFVYKGWLDAAANLDKPECLGKIGKVEAHVLAWLREHETSKDAQFVYRSWLDAAANLAKPECLHKVGKVEAHVLAWLGKHEMSEDAGFVYKGWLDAGGSIDRVRVSIFDWLAANFDSDQTDFLLKAWLEATRDFNSVRVPALQWFKRNKDKLDAVYVLKFIVRERELPSDAIEDVIAWCTTFPHVLDSVCRIFPILSHYGSGTLEKPLIDAAMLVLEHIRMDWLTDKGVRDATVATIGVLAWKLRFISDFGSRLDDVHANVFLSPATYQAAFVPSTPNFVLNPALAQHVVGLVERKIIDPVRHRSDFERFADWLAAWPPERKRSLQPAMQVLERSCAIPGLWKSVGALGMEQAESFNDDASHLDRVLEKLSDIQMAPHVWSNLWEKQGWKRFPGEPRLVVVARKWLFEAAPDPSWPFVWEPLFLYFPGDREIENVALWWLEYCGPRDRGAWAFVWMLLWDHGCARDRLATLGRAWLQDYEGKHKYWTDVRARLDTEGQ